jgi:molybdate-binding protein/DNA-binding transcriptional regulator YhcF (GntR family)
VERWLQIELEPAAGPIYAQIVAQVVAARDAGHLAPGARLPPIRDLAAQLGVNRNTVAHAYRQLRRLGAIAGHAGRGTRLVDPPAIVPAEGADTSGLDRPAQAAPVQQRLWRQAPLAAPGAGTLLRCQGSHDFCLDLLARRMRAVAAHLRLVCTPVGSTAGLLALGQGAAQLAGLHLLDAATGEYNRPFVRRLLPGAEIRLVTLVEREQGLIVRRGNPLAIRDAADLARPELRFAARQPGSGTQVLLDHLLARHGLSDAQVARPTAPLATHLAVAAAVAGGRADAGLGVRAAARALDLDFIPLATERYDLAFRHADEDSDWVAVLLEALASPELRAYIETLPGYDASHTAWMNL